MSSQKIKDKILAGIPRKTIPTVARKHGISRNRIYELLNEENFGHPAIAELVIIMEEQLVQKKMVIDKVKSLT